MEKSMIEFIPMVWKKSGVGFGGNNFSWYELIFPRNLTLLMCRDFPLHLIFFEE